MSNLPDLQHVGKSTEAAGSAGPAADRMIVLSDKNDKPMKYIEARAVPGAVYSHEHGGMILPWPTARAAIVALTMKPSLASEYPELVELRDTLLTTVRPTDYATKAGISINAPVVHQSLLEQGSDWLDFELDPGATQATDLGFAAAMLQKIHAFYLGWARGYGKTLGTAAIIEANGYEQVLVAAPNSSKADTWAMELLKRLPSHDVLIMPNDKVRRIELLEFLKRGGPGRPFVLITHHESLSLVAKWGRRDGQPDPTFGGWKKLHLRWDLFVVDEVHRLAHATTQMHRGARNVPSENRLGLSGSVYQNDWEELYGPLSWLLPSEYHSQWDDWNLRHFDYVEGYGKIWAGFLPGHEQKIRDELGVFMVVREKPDKSIKSEIMVDLGEKQRQAYDELVDNYVTLLEDGTAVIAEQGMVMLQRCRQIATGLELLSAQVVDSSKLDAVVDIILSKPQDDYFVAGWYKASVYALRDRLQEAGIEDVFAITGDTPIKQRPAIIRAAREAQLQQGLYGSRRTVVLIGTIETLGESVNLQFLNHVIRIDRSWNPAKNRQVVDRCDRTGQQRDIYLDDIIARDTVDQLVVMPNLANKDAMRAILLGRTS
jgi:SNF2 family DNA or RNA helicase